MRMLAFHATTLGDHNRRSGRMLQHSSSSLICHQPTLCWFELLIVRVVRPHFRRILSFHRVEEDCRRTICVLFTKLRHDPSSDSTGQYRVLQPPFMWQPARSNRSSDVRQFPSTGVRYASGTVTRDGATAENGICNGCLGTAGLWSSRRL